MRRKDDTGNTRLTAA
jgi:hypothetical protein